ncbi:MAG: FUSC family protein [Gaiellales bacterium]
MDHAISYSLVRRARAALEARTEGFSRLLWPTAQTALAAGLAWELARRGLDHRSPMFAPITTVVAMGFTAGRRGRAAVFLVVGVALGIGIADLMLTVLDPGGPQIGIIVFVAMCLALLVSREPLFVTQAAISGLLLITVDRDMGGLAPDRLGDALVGGGVALVVATVLFPIDPVAEVQRGTEPVVARLVESLRDSAHGLAHGDLARAERARSFTVADTELAEIVSVSLDATRVALRRRRDRSRVWEYAVAVGHLETVIRGARTIAGASRRLVVAGRTPRADLAAAVAALASAVELLGSALEEAAGHAYDETRAAAVEAARLARSIPADTGIGVGTIVHLVHVLAVAVVRATGVEAAEAEAMCGVPGRR